MSTVEVKGNLYVYKFTGGYTTRGTQNLFDETRQLWDYLTSAGRINNLALCPLDEDLGSMTVVDKNRQLIAIASRYTLPTWFHPGTPKVVQNILERARKSQSRLRLFYGDTKTGRDWLGSSDVIGRIGRSTGTLRIPLLIADSAIGGPGVLDHCIVRIIDVASRREVYRHPTYQLGNLAIVPGDRSDYPFSVYRDESLQANFSSYAKAAHYIAFSAGESLDLPD